MHRYKPENVLISDFVRASMKIKNMCLLIYVKLIIINRLKAKYLGGFTEINQKPIRRDR